MKRRDPQKQRLYKAEFAWEKNGGKERFKRFATHAECEKYLAKVMKRGRIKKAFPIFGFRVPEVMHGNRNGHATSWGGRITVSPGAMCENVLLHELAHELLPRGVHHGWEFAKALLFIVRQVLGKEEEAKLKAEFKTRKVKFRKPNKRTITPEQREILVERIKVARAARNK